MWLSPLLIAVRWPFVEARVFSAFVTLRIPLWTIIAITIGMLSIWLRAIVAVITGTFLAVFLSAGVVATPLWLPLAVLWLTVVVTVRFVTLLVVEASILSIITFGFSPKWAVFPFSVLSLIVVRLRLAIAIRSVANRTIV